MDNHDIALVLNYCVDNNITHGKHKASDIAMYPDDMWTHIVFEWIDNKLYVSPHTMFLVDIPYHYEDITARFFNEYDKKAPD